MSELVVQMRWIMRGRQKQSVAKTLRKPMTATQICEACQGMNPKIQLRDVWFILRQFRQHKLAECLTPNAVTGKLYFLTEFGREVVGKGFGLTFDPSVEDLDW